MRILEHVGDMCFTKVITHISKISIYCKCIVELFIYIQTNPVLFSIEVNIFIYVMFPFFFLQILISIYNIFYFSPTCTNCSYVYFIFLGLILLWKLSHFSLRQYSQEYLRLWSNYFKVSIMSNVHGSFLLWIHTFKTTY